MGENQSPVVVPSARSARRVRPPCAGTCVRVRLVALNVN